MDKTLLTLSASQKLAEQFEVLRSLLLSAQPNAEADFVDDTNFSIALWRSAGVFR